MSDMVERRLVEYEQARNARYAKLASDIYYQVTANHLSSGGAVVEIRRLLVEFFTGGAASPGPPVVMGSADFASPKRWGWTL
ncbi:MAG TPA: hypothetical protein VIP77_16010 [Jiangellaceae bacterium]